MPDAFLWQKMTSSAVALVTTVSVVLLGVSLQQEKPDPLLVTSMADDDEVLLVLSGKGRTDLSELSGQLRQFEQKPGDENLADIIASSALALFSETGNERYAGLARQAIDFWWHDDTPPAAIWLHRGRLLQLQHQFIEAAQDLAQFSIHHPGRSDALLLEADSWRRGGRIQEAKQACLKLALAGESLLARYCAAQVLLTLGQPDNALSSLPADRTVLENQSESLARWALGIEADLLVSLGRDTEALGLWAEAMQKGSPSLPEVLAYTDLLLMTEDHEEADRLLQQQPAVPAVQLRRAYLAKQTEDLKAFDRLAETLRPLYKPVDTGTDAQVHLREQSLYALWIEDDTARATRLALDNWHLQKGWEDAELLITAARVAGLPSASQQVLDWRARHSGPAE